MKSFRTIVSVEASKSKIGLKSGVLTAGSCFADVIGGKLHLNKFKTLTNPFGVIYNPLSIHKVLSYGINNAELPPDTFLENNGIHLNYNFHSQFSSLKKDGLASKLAGTVSQVHHFLKETEWILITYGTAWVYQRKNTKEVVANCHKVPSHHFEKKLLTESEILETFEHVYKRIKEINPNIKIILTVSPVRHIKDTLELNSVSKSLLRVACYRLASTFDSVEYFPSFEIMMDDLRDYRFYKSDMIHPSEDAEDYIWEKFGDCYFNEAAKDFIKQWQALASALQHKPFHPSSPSHQQFLRDTLKKLESLKSIARVDEEITLIKGKLL